MTTRGMTTENCFKHGIHSIPFVGKCHVCERREKEEYEENERRVERALQSAWEKNGERISRGE